MSQNVDLVCSRLEVHLKAVVLDLLQLDQNLMHCQYDESDIENLL